MLSYTYRTYSTELGLDGDIGAALTIERLCQCRRQGLLVDGDCFRGPDDGFTGRGREGAGFDGTLCGSAMDGRNQCGLLCDWRVWIEKGRSWARTGVKHTMLLGKQACLQ